MSNDDLLQWVADTYGLEGMLAEAVVTEARQRYMQSQ